MRALAELGRLSPFGISLITSTPAQTAAHGGRSPQRCSKAREQARLEERGLEPAIAIFGQVYIERAALCAESVVC